MGASSMLRNVFGGFKNFYVYLKMDKSLHACPLQKLGLTSKYKLSL